jgi:ribosome-associated heat shock protein Hsp15
MAEVSAIAPQAKNDSSVRLDRWLWAVRLFKTRGLAATACRLGQVRAGGDPAKAARQVRVGDEFEVECGGLCRRVRVIAPLGKRVGAKLVPESMQDITSPEVLEAARKEAELRRANRIVVDSGEGRPTKRQRREMEAFLEEIDRFSDR